MTGCTWVVQVLRKWVQRTRDAEFLVELRLTNLEVPQAEEKEATEAVAQ